MMLLDKKQILKVREWEDLQSAKGVFNYSNIPLLDCGWVEALNE